MKALFLYNPLDLDAAIPGGVQICSRKFLKIIKLSSDELYYFGVNYSKSLLFRFLHKINFDLYQAYAVKRYREKLVSVLIEKNITHVFINKAELTRFSRLIKESNLPNKPKVIIMSHGNESGDLLGDLTNAPKGILKYAGIFKLGIVLYLESHFRKRYVDLVCTMSLEESAIERWLGMNKPFFIPQMIDRNVRIDRNPTAGIYGYVGTLDHVPNSTALNMLFSALIKAQLNIEIRIAGQPAEVGKMLAANYPFVSYLGPLSDDELQKEIQTWSFFINPVFNYSRGASMKLAKAIEWEIPVITTMAGRRGYYWNDNYTLQSEDNVVDFIEKIKLANGELHSYSTYSEQIKLIRDNSPDAEKLSSELKTALSIINKTPAN